MPSWVRCELTLPTRRETPKSSSFGKMPSASFTRNTFSGLRSRWTMPASWTAARPRRVKETMRQPSVTDMGSSRAIRSARLSPSSSSMTMNGSPASVMPKSLISMTLRWRTDAATRASRMKRSVSFLGAGAPGMEELQRHGAAEGHVLRAPDGSHAAFADLSDQPIAAPDHGARRVHFDGYRRTADRSGSACFGPGVPIPEGGPPPPLSRPGPRPPPLRRLRSAVRGGPRGRRRNAGRRGRSQ